MGQRSAEVGRGWSAADRPAAVGSGRVDALDGLRAIAVAGVLAYHAGVGQVAGGMFGVDLFFVLSGFLITGLLLKERSRDGRINLGRFWGRRARRLLPPLLLTLAGAMAYARWGDAGLSMARVRGDALSALGYVANWRFVFSGQGYFARYGAPSPLLHTWSLGVEEQFYLLWPLIVVFAARRGGARAVTRVATVGALVSAGLTAVLHHTGVSESALYYGTDTRAQALLVGAALAGWLALRASQPGEGYGAGGVGVPALARRLGLRGPQPGAGYGAGGVGVPALARRLGLRGPQPGAGYGAGGVGVPALARRLGLRGPQPGVILAAAGWAAAAGLIWMFHAVSGSSTWLYDGGFLLVAVAGMAVVASVALHPAGSLAWVLARRPLVALGRISYGVYLYHWPLFNWLDGTRTGLRGWDLTWVRVGVTLGVATASYFVVERPIRHLGRSAAVAGSGAAAQPRLGRLRRRPLATALATFVSSAAVVGATLPASVAAGSVRVLAAPPADPGVQTTSLVVGDSIGLTLGIGLSYQSPRWGVTVIPGASLGCDLDPTSTVEVMGVVSKASQGCPEWRTSWAGLIDKDNPDTVLLVLGRWEVLNRIYDGHWTHIGEAAWDTHLTGELDQAIDVLSSRGANVLVTTLPYIRGTSDQPDGEPWDMNVPARTDAYNRVVRAAVAARPATARVLDLNALADPDGHYASYIDGIRVRNKDDEHFSPAGGEYLRPSILPELQTLGSRHARARHTVVHAT